LEDGQGNIETPEDTSDMGVQFTNPVVPTNMEEHDHLNKGR